MEIWEKRRAAPSRAMVLRPADGPDWQDQRCSLRPRMSSWQRRNKTRAEAVRGQVGSFETIIMHFTHQTSVYKQRRRQFGCAKLSIPRVCPWRSSRRLSARVISEDMTTIQLSSSWYILNPLSAIPSTTALFSSTLKDRASVSVEKARMAQFLLQGSAERPL